MSRLKFLFLKNSMLAANFIANFVGVFFVNYLMRIADRPLPDEIAPVIYRVDSIFNPASFIFVMLLSLIYERPIRRYLLFKFRGETAPDEVQSMARRRLLNEPFVFILIDFCMWFLAAILYSLMFWRLGADPNLIQRPLFSSISIGLITVTVAFFLLEHVLQKQLVIHFFPGGGLYQIPKTLRIRIRTRLTALLFGCNLVPFFYLLSCIQRLSSINSENVAIADQMRSTIFMGSLTFMGIGICLTVLVSRNLTLPFQEILTTLQEVRNGIFEKKVRVTSNDEIGYTGDVINEMTEGLKDREMIKDTFGRYVAPEVRDEILSGRIPLDGEMKEVTVLFADLRDFTPMTEAYPPREVVQVLNMYFERMSEAIEAEGGLVLQFIGDEIYAVFGAPLSRPGHPASAFKAGLKMNQRLAELNEEFLGKGWPQLRHGIGIHTGSALAANIGSPNRLSYLLVGDTINLASRLQSLSKEVGSGMIISTETCSQLAHEDLQGSVLRKLPPIHIKGKRQPVEIFSVT